MTPKQPSSWKRVSVTLCLLGLLALLVAWPLGGLFWDVVPTKHGEWEALRRILVNNDLQESAIRSLLIALTACALASILAVPLAFAAVRSTPLARGTIIALGILPLFTPPFVSAMVFGRLSEVLSDLGLSMTQASAGVFDDHLLLILTYASHFLPFILFSLLIRLTTIDRSLQETARNLQASRWKIWRTVTLPQAAPAYAFGACVALLKMLEDVGAPLMLGHNDLLAPQLLSGLHLGSEQGMRLAIAAALVLFTISALIVLLAWHPLSRATSSTATGKQPLRWRRGPAMRLVSVGLILAVGAVSLGPLAWLVVLSLGGGTSGKLWPTLSAHNFTAALQSALPSLPPSLTFAALTGVMVMLLSTLAAVLYRPSTRSGRSVRFAVNTLFAVPGLVLALAYWEMIGQYRESWPGITLFALISVVVLKQIPLAQHLFNGPLRELRNGGLTSAANLGSAASARSLGISIPTLSGAMGGAFAIGLAAALSELSAVLVLLQDREIPFAVQVYHTLRTVGQGPIGAALGVFLAGLLAAALLAVYAQLRRPWRQAHPVNRQTANALAEMV